MLKESIFNVSFYFGQYIQKYINGLKTTFISMQGNLKKVYRSMTAIF